MRNKTKNKKNNLKKNFDIERDEMFSIFELYIIL